MKEEEEKQLERGCNFHHNHREKTKKFNQHKKFNIQREYIDSSFLKGFSEKQKDDMIVQPLES